jgi:hypothetical protein
MAFRLAGEAWDGQKFRVVNSLSRLLQEITAKYDDRQETIDGTVASRGHDAVSPTSDHTPKPADADPGLVRAGDVTASTVIGMHLTEFLRQLQDPRIKYVIHDRRMFSSYSNSRRDAWEWGEYTGSSPHTGHVHISVLESNQDDGSEWGLSDAAGVVDMAAMQIEDIQQALVDADQRDADGNVLVVDGDYGAKSAYALGNGLRDGLATPTPAPDLSGYAKTGHTHPEYADKDHPHKVITTQIVR